MELENELLQSCKNCEALVTSNGKYCTQCGQQFTTGHVTLWKLLSDVFQSIINIDSKLIRTLLTLFVPGKLTVEYFKGRHKKYAPPIRVFFWGTLILIGALGIQMNQQKNALNFKNSRDEWKTHQLLDNLVTYKPLTVTKFAEQDLATQVVDTFLYFVMLSDSTYRDSTEININITNDSSLFIARRDLFELTANEIVEKYQITGFWNKLIKRQSIKIAQEIEADKLNIIDIVIQRVTPLLFVSIPFFALFLKLLYIRRNRYYVEHFIFTMHVNAFVFIFLALIITINSDWGEAFQRFILLGLILYIVIAMKKVYAQSWGKTILKFGISTIGYFFSLSIALILVTLFSILVY